MMMHSAEEISMVIYAVIALVILGGLGYIMVTGGSDEHTG